VAVTLLAVAAAIVATPIAMALARRFDILDHPGPLKVHDRPVPYLGGLGVAAGLAVGLLSSHHRLAMPLGLALLLGLADDARDIPAWSRFAGEVAIGAVVAAQVPVRLPAPWSWLAIVTVVVLLINGVNMVDGLDGLASGVALAGAVAFALLLSGSDRRLALAFAGGLAGFLVYNRSPARVYLGDAGSYLCGASLAVLLVLAWRPGRSTSVSASALTFVAYPVTEVAFAVVRRVRGRVSLFQGDRGHVYDRLVDRGWAPPAASAACVGGQAAIAAAGVAASHLTKMTASVVVALIGTAVVVMGAKAGFLATSPNPTSTGE
jgi:UDP-GlcNAc:undecaprenyl-phosphate GlcNAc-1-phosphate transferase